jgi:hypothetical protein
LAHFKNAVSTALELGHYDSRVTFAHCRELVNRKMLIGTEFETSRNDESCSARAAMKRRTNTRATRRGIEMGA